MHPVNPGLAYPVCPGNRNTRLQRHKMRSPTLSAFDRNCGQRSLQKDLAGQHGQLDGRKWVVEVFRGSGEYEVNLFPGSPLICAV